jgi:glycosyltransferase involved in cell wall biosynthesis
VNGRDERHLWVWYAPCGLGGVETYLLNMVRETIADGIPVWVAATTDAQGPLREQLLATGATLLDWSEFHPAYMGQVDPAPVQQRLLDELARIRPTLLALNDCNDFSIGAAPLVRRLRPYCTVLDTFHIDSPVGQYLDFRAVFVDALDGIAATNRNIIEAFRRQFGASAGPELRYIANGVRLEPRPRRGSDGRLRLLYVGRLAQDQKRILELPALLAALRERGRDFEMTIVGDGPCRGQLQAELEARELQDSVRLTGYLPPEQTHPLYFEHDACVNISTFEGFSMTVLEAFAAGCVPVCTDVASLDKDVFRDGVNCRLCPVDDLGAIVGIWEALTPEALARLREGALQVGATFTSAHTWRQYRAFVEDLRGTRPLAPWPADARTALDGAWSLTERNPWLHRPGPLRQALRRAAALFGGGGR